MSAKGSPDNLPNGLGIGAAKCGTSSFRRLIAQHPDVFVPEVDEPHFFDNSQNYRQGRDAWLDRHFADAGRYAARVEITPSYLHLAGRVIPRIRETYHDAEPPRLICLLRDPVERCRSHYQHMVRAALETECLERAIELEEERRTAADGIWWRGYFRDGQYARQLEPWIDAFGRERLLVLFNEDLAARPQEVLREAFVFLGVDCDLVVDTKRRHNAAATYRSRTLARWIHRPSALKRRVRRFLPTGLVRSGKRWLAAGNTRPLADDERQIVSAELEARLREAYRPDVERLEALLDRDLSAWQPRI